MENLIEEYNNEITDIIKLLDNTNSNGSENDIKKIARLNSKLSEYKTFVIKLQNLVHEEDLKQNASEKENNENIATLTRLYYSYKKTSDSEIQEYLKKIKIVKKEMHAGGKITKYYPLNVKSIKKIKNEPRNISLTFDATEINTRAISGLEEYKRIPYLCKSSSKFFLKPDIGEIFDAIDWQDLMCDKIDAICFDNGYETLPNTEGEHHLMYATLLINLKARAKKEKEKAITELNEL